MPIRKQKTRGKMSRLKWVYFLKGDDKRAFWCSGLLENVFATKMPLIISIFSSLHMQPVLSFWISEYKLLIIAAEAWPCTLRSGLAGLDHRTQAMQRGSSPQMTTMPLGYRHTFSGIPERSNRYQQVLIISFLLQLGEHERQTWSLKRWF